MPEIVNFPGSDPRDAIHKVVQSLVEGHLVGLPTETGYCVAALSADAGASERLNALLRRADIPDALLAVKGPQEAIDYLPDVPRPADKLFRRFWPGPVTLATAPPWTGGLSNSLPEAARATWARSGWAAVRAPGGDVVPAVLRLLPAPLLLSGEMSASGRQFPDAGSLSALCGQDLSQLVDAGRCKYGGPTTLVRVSSDAWEIEREGVVSRRTLQRLAGTLYVFVCTGNTCRSPMAEGLFRHLVAQRLKCGEDDLVDRGYFAASAGVAASTGSPPSPEAVEVLRDYGVDLQAHESRPVTPTLLSQADRIFTMTRSHREQLHRAFPEMVGRVQLLAKDGSDIIDPIGCGIEEYRRCAEQIGAHLRPIVDELFAENRSSPA